MEHIYDMVIVGGGPAGYTAALYASRAGLDTLLFEKLSVGGQMTLTDVIDNYPGFDEGIEGYLLGMKMQMGAERFGALTRYEEVVSLDLVPKIKKIVTDSGEYLARTVVISTGASPRLLGLEREELFTGRGVHYCAHCDGRFYKDKTVALVGGGNSAASDAVYLSRLVKKLYLIHRRDTLRATRIYHEPLMALENMEFVPNSVVSEILGDNKLTGVRLRDVETQKERDIESDALFVSIGRVPVTDAVSDQLELDEYGYIAADETTRTNIEGVYAVGDVRAKALRQVVTAIADGAVAVHFAEEYLLKNKQN